MTAIQAIAFVSAVAAGVSIATPPPAQPVVVLRLMHRPALQLACDQRGREEYTRTCRARSKSL